MNIVNSGTRYQIYSDDLQTMKTLPAGAYDVRFAKYTGFFLESRPPLAVKEEKIYGKSSVKTDKILSGYEKTDRNFGVMLSGPRGVGKSLFARLLIEKGIAKGYPVILVSDYIPGVADFLSSIQQEVIVLFDEFEKVFSKKEDSDPQTELLPMFDGTDSGKKLFVITCNDTKKLNECLLDRPGRFYYHFTMTPPTAEEIREYMTDKLTTPSDDVLSKVISYSSMANLTYDCLRAIAEELNRGYDLEETMEDLNISRERGAKYKIKVVLSDGTAGSDDFSYAYFDNGYDEYKHWFCGIGGPGFRIEFDMDAIYMDPISGAYTADPASIKVTTDRDDCDSDEEFARIKARKIKSLTISRVLSKNIHKLA
ncbi:MAG: ATP-binding protein [Clostridia bacterium]|nr:ATP-binding protein [Clostridia bacterium]